jgi:hypothetical protein
LMEQNKDLYSDLRSQMAWFINLFVYVSII